MDNNQGQTNTQTTNSPTLKLQLFDHQTLLLMSLQKLRDPSDTSKPLLNRTDLVQNLGDNKAAAHEKLASTSSQFRDLPKLGIPKLNEALQNGTVSKQDWYDAKLATFTEAKQAESLDPQATRYRTVKDQPIGAINFTDPEYPDNLWTEKNKDFPPVLTYQGDKNVLNQGPSVTLVGSRGLNPAAEVTTGKYGAQFSSDGVNTVSGLATGADAAGAKGNLMYLALLKQEKPEQFAKAGKPIHILSKGLDTSIYPKENHGLAKDIVHNGGALVSEYSPSDTAQSPGAFVHQLIARDKWQAVMADGLVATQSGLTRQRNGVYRPSGTRHALSEALDQNRPTAMLDVNQSQALKNKDLDRSFYDNQVNIANGKAMGLGSDLNDPNVLKQFDKFEKQMKTNHQNRMDYLHQNQNAKQNQNDGFDRR